MISEKQIEEVEQRYRDYAQAREENREKLKAGDVLAANAPERVSGRLSRLRVAALRLATPNLL